MRCRVIALVVVAASSLQAQRDCTHAGRNALIGAAAGATLMVSMALRTPRSHDTLSHIKSSRSVMVTWVGTWGAGLGSIIPAHGCLQPSPAHRDAAGRCGSAVRTGALRGAATGGIEAFMMSPILAVPMMIPWGGGVPRINLDHVMGLITAGGVALGAPAGAVRAANECHRS
jgi:hypothetical protein